MVIYFGKSSSVLLFPEYFAFNIESSPAHSTKRNKITSELIVRNYNFVFLESVMKVNFNFFHQFF